MAEIVRMPKLSDTMVEGVVAEWHKKIGDEVESGDLLAEIETDKATMEFESFQDGVLLHIGVEKGQTAAVDSILAILGEKGEDVSAILAEEKDSPASQVEELTVAKESEKKVETSTSKTIEKEVEVPEQVTVATPAVNADGRIVASPLAKRLANEKGIDLNAVQGTGDNGRIVKRDIDHYVPYPAVTSAKPLATSVAGTESYIDEPVSQMRKVIARRLGESKFSAPHFYLTIDIDMDYVMDTRKMVNQHTDVKISFNDFVIKASAVALKKNPIVNSAWMGDAIRYNDHVHVGVAVAVPDGLLVPVIRHADMKSLSQISAEVKELAGKAKDKKLQPAEWEGNTFSISNLGMFGIEEFTAIINPPDSCIMAVGGIRQEPVVKDGQIVVGNRMKVTLSCDHRVVDGASGAKFLNDFKLNMENPVMMIA